MLARDAANPVRLRIGDGTLTLLAQTAEVGDDEAPLTATVKGDDVQIAFNARYMLDALSALDSDEVHAVVQRLAAARRDPTRRDATTTSASSCRCASRSAASRTVASGLVTSP